MKTCLQKRCMKRQQQSLSSSPSFEQINTHAKPTLESLICSNISPPNRYKWHSINRTGNLCGLATTPCCVKVREGRGGTSRRMLPRRWSSDCETKARVIWAKASGGRVDCRVTQEFHVWVLGSVYVCDKTAWVEEDAEANKHGSLNDQICT